MTPHPLLSLAVLAVLILLCRPWIEARRPIASLGLLLGVALGPGGADLIPSVVRGGLDPVGALAAGWLALLAAESLDLETLRRLPAPGRLWLMSIPAAVLGTMGWFIGDGLALPMACLALALDPDAVRHALSQASRPDIAARFAPMLAAVALGLALLCSVATTQAPAALPATAAHAALTIMLGVGLGFFFVGPLRIAEGKGFLLALMVSMPLLGWGVATRLGMSAPGVIFVSGLVVAHDRTRRQLFFTLLREHERLFTIALMLGTGAGLAYGRALLLDVRFWWLAAALLVARPLTWGLARTGGITAVAALSLSPLALPLAALGWVSRQPPEGIDPLPAAVGAAFVLSEAAWLWFGRATAVSPAPVRTTAARQGEGA